MLALRDAIPWTAPLARAEFTTLRLRLLKIGAPVIEKATRIRIHFTSACPDANLFRLLAVSLAAAGPCVPGRRAPITQAPSPLNPMATDPKTLRQTAPGSDATRHNMRSLDTIDKFRETVERMNGKRLTYSDLIADNGLDSGARPARS